MNFIDPMLANPLEIDAIHKAQGYLMEPKLDGWRCIAVRGPDGVQLFTRTGKPLHAKVPDVACELLRLSPAPFILDGELGYANKARTIIDYNKTARVLGSEPAAARSKIEENGASPTFVVFDMLQAAGLSYLQVPQRERSMFLRKALQDAHIAGDIDPKLVHVTPLMDMWDEETYIGLVGEGAEGVILKNPAAPYYPGKRPAHHWYKVKKFQTMDVIITGFVLGQGKYSGQVGAVQFSLWCSETEGPGLPVGQCSGMTDELRNHMTHNWETDYLNHVMEIRFFGKVGRNTEGLRHPQFVRMRPDKLPHECV